jgi:dUTP pyrophosphatase
MSTFKSPIPEFKWKRTLENAVEPTKNISSDSGYDLTVISKIKEFNGVCYYDTGICVEPPDGFYFDVVGRSSISKTGWMLANNIGIIDATYRGSIIVALIKVYDDADEIQLPMRLVQMIPRSLILMENIEVDSLSDTVRGSGGFGSSG